MLKLVSRRIPRRALQRIVAALGLIFGVYVLYLWRLGSLTVGLSPSESMARQLSSSLSQIVDNPVNAPLRTVQYLAQYFGHNGAYYMRFGTVLFMILFVGCFYLLLKNWFGRLIGFLGTVLLVGTPWLILSARSANATILFLAPLTIMTAFLWLSGSKQSSKLAFLILVVVSAVCLYIPGMIWFILAASLMRRRELLTHLKSHGASIKSLASLLGVIIIFPLGIAIAYDVSVGRNLLLLPENWQGGITSLKSIAWSVLSLFWHTPYHIDSIIGRLPLLGITQLALATFGGYAMWTNARKVTYGLVTMLVASIIFSGLNANLEILVLAVLAVSIFAAAGLRYLYVEWRSIFPRNPLPKALAICLMVLVVGLHLAFGIRYALVAWPNTTETRTLYMIK